jgi:hypothetical protein
MSLTPAAATAALKRYAEAPLIDRSGGLGRVDAGEVITQVAIAKITDVGCGEALALPEAAAGIRIKNRPSSLNQSRSQTRSGE